MRHVAFPASTNCGGCKFEGSDTRSESLERGPDAGFGNFHALSFLYREQSFFKKLRQELGSDLKIVAALPEQPDDARKYLNDNGLSVDQVTQLSLTTIGVTGTPTMILVSGRGVVTNVWVGKLSTEDQDKVLSVLRRKA